MRLRVGMDTMTEIMCSHAIWYWCYCYGSGGCLLIKCNEHLKWGFSTLNEPTLFSLLFEFWLNDGYSLCGCVLVCFVCMCGWYGNGLWICLLAGWLCAEWYDANGWENCQWVGAWMLFDYCGWVRHELILEWPQKGLSRLKLNSIFSSFLEFHPSALSVKGWHVIKRAHSAPPTPLISNLSHWTLSFPDEPPPKGTHRHLMPSGGGLKTAVKLNRFPFNPASSRLTIISFERKRYDTIST